MNDRTTDELADAIEDVEADDSVRVLIITGAGRSFCSGGDLEALRGGGEERSWASEHPEDIRRSFKRAQRLMLTLQRMEKPVIGMINDPAVDAGFDLETGMKMAGAGETITLTSWDHQEGMAAFRGSRKPVYGGR